MGKLKTKVTERRRVETGLAKSKAHSTPTIDVRKLALDAAVLLEQKANSAPANEGKDIKRIEPTGVFHQRADRRS